MENSPFKSAVNQSISDDLVHKKQKKFHRMNDLEGKLNFLYRNYSSVVRQKETLIICSIIKFLYPKTNLSLVIESDFAVHVFCRDVESNKIEDYKIPKHVADQNSLEILIKSMKKMDIEQRQTEPQNMNFFIKIGNIKQTF